MSVGWDYVSERRPPTGLLLIPQVIYEHGEQWWNNTDREELLICPPDLIANVTNSYLVTKQQELAKKVSSVKTTQYYIP
jgi:hypothetical protein